MLLNLLVLTSMSQDGCTALMHASRVEGTLAIAEMLLDRGASIDIADKVGDTTVCAPYTISSRGMKQATKEISKKSEY